MKRQFLLLLLVFAIGLVIADPINEKLWENLSWRSIGPAIMGGRVTDIEGDSNSRKIFVATASGGLWKTQNNGTSWECIFENQSTISIGDIALDPKNSDVIWVGAGESNVRNSASIGDGVYKSLDGGKTWNHMGLVETEHISRVIVDPLDSNTVYVAALGHAYGPNPERGVFKTTDGGKTWKHVLFIDKRHGISDMEINPQNPNILYAAAWHFERKPWTHTSGSEDGGVYRSLDRGKTWNKLQNGLPKLMGRIGVKVAASNPKVVYVIAETNEGLLFRSDDHGENFTVVNSKQKNIVARGFYYADMRVDPSNENKLYALASTLFQSIDGGKNFNAISPKTHVDYHALWIDPKNPDILWQGQDGGVAVSYDAGKNWDYLNNMPLCQVYQISVDNQQPFYNIHFGLQDNGCWTGPSRTREPYGILNEDWRMVSFGDGFFIFNHPDNPDLFLSESQGGWLVRTNFKNREQQSVRPNAESLWGAPLHQAQYRFHWNTPLIPSLHDKNTVYCAGNVVFRSKDFASSWEKISPDLTTNDLRKQQSAGGPVWYENTAAEYHCTIISLAESPLNPDILWAGTDDGNIQFTTDAGKTWNNVIQNIPEVPNNSPVSHVELSRTKPEVVYAAFDRHMLDDFTPYIFKSEDSGKTWKNISGNLPQRSYVWVVREDPKNPKVLYAGTEMGLYVSYNDGKKWLRLHLKNLPTVAVHDIAIHSQTNDMILGTHGRGIWVYDDITPIQQLHEATQQESYLFTTRPAIIHAVEMTRYGIGDKVFRGPNPPYGALIHYYLNADVAGEVSIDIVDSNQKVVRTLKKLPTKAGIHRVVWDLRHNKVASSRPNRELPGREVVPGTYTVKLTIAQKQLETPISVILDPSITKDTSHLTKVDQDLQQVYEMLDVLGKQLQKVSRIENQLSQLKENISKLEGDSSLYTKQLDEYLKTIQTLQEKFERGENNNSEKPKFLQELLFLTFSYKSNEYPPSAVQQQKLEELRKEYSELAKELENFLAETVTSWNKNLQEQGMVGLLLQLPAKKEEQNK